MSFRMRNTNNGFNSEQQDRSLDPPKIYTQEEIDLIEERYKEKEKRMRRFVDEPANPLLDQYRQNLIQQHTYEKEAIIYDQNTGKWKLVKTSEKQDT
jgi:hypothetical protein